MGHEQAQLVGRATSGRRRSGRRGPRSACSIARSTDTTMSPRWIRRPGGQANAAAPRRRSRPRRLARRAPGTPRAGAAGTTARRSGRRRPMCVAFSAASSASSVRISPIEAGDGAPAASSAAAIARASAAIGSSRHAGRRRVDRPPSRTIERRSASGADGRSPGHAPGAGPPRRAPRLELDDLVLRVGDPLVVHAEELRDERLAGSARCRAGSGRTRRTGRRSMRSSMIRATIARIAGSSRDDERAHGRLDAVGQHDQRRLARSAASGRRGGTCARRPRRRPARPPPSPGRRTARPRSSRAVA